MILSFKPLLVPDIESGRKIHTIREDPHKRWHSGRMIHMATGVRTKNYKQFGYLPCISVQEVLIQKSYSSPSHVAFGLYIDLMNRNYLMEKLAYNDGFDTIREFIDWFIPKDEGEVVRRIIHWTAKKY